MAELLPSYKDWQNFDYPKKLREKVVESYTLLNSFEDLEEIFISEDDFVETFMHKWYEQEIVDIVNG